MSISVVGRPVTSAGQLHGRCRVVQPAAGCRGGSTRRRTAVRSRYHDTHYRQQHDRAEEYGETEYRLHGHVTGHIDKCTTRFLLTGRDYVIVTSRAPAE